MRLTLETVDDHLHILAVLQSNLFQTIVETLLVFGLEWAMASVAAEQMKGCVIMTIDFSIIITILRVERKKILFTIGLLDYFSLIFWTCY